MIPPYEPVGGSQSMFDICMINKSIPQISCEKKYSTLHVAILFIAQFIMGGGTTPLYTLGKWSAANRRDIYRWYACRSKP